MLGFGQGVNISSPEDPGPTDANPLPLNINFEDGVDELNSLDFNVDNGDIQNISREIPDFDNKEPDRVLEDTLVAVSTGELIGAFISENVDGLLREKLKKSVISIDFNKNNELFYLTLNNGVFKYDIILRKYIPTETNRRINRQDENSSIYLLKK